MALFLQLLTEDDLRDLSVEERGTLRATFYHTLYNNQAIRGELSVAIRRSLDGIRARRPSPSTQTGG
jgi:hypothetical protein